MLRTRLSGQVRLSQPNKRPRRDDEVSLYWSSDDDDVEMFLDNSAGPSSRCATLVSPLDATNLFPSGYNTLLATIETTSIVPYYFNPVVLGGNICFSHGLETSGLWLANYSLGNLLL